MQMTRPCVEKLQGRLILNILKRNKHVTEWLKMNKLSLNAKKTKAMLLPQTKIIVPKIKINGTIIEFVFNFLGINLNKHLNWNPHVKIVVKTVGVLNILEDTTVRYITYHMQRTDIVTPKLWNPSVGPPSKTTKSDTKTSC